MGLKPLAYCARYGASVQRAADQEVKRRMQMAIDDSTGASVSRIAAGGLDVAATPRGSVLERRIADGSYTADAHALARSFLEYLEHLAGPA
jgi:hypothetical protein